MSEASKELEMITLKQICEELNISPASARRKLRTKVDKSAGDFRWEFTDKQAVEIKALLATKEVEEAVAA